MAVSYGQTDVFFAALETLMQESHPICKPQCIYSADESGLQHFFTPKEIIA
jgi:hypothetical protein